MSRRWVPTRKRRGSGGVLTVLDVLLDEEERWKEG